MNKLLERKINEEEYLVIMQFKKDGDVYFGFTRNLGYLDLEKTLFFRSRFKDVGVNSIYLSPETLSIFELYLPVPSCPNEVKEKLIMNILKDNPFLTYETNTSLIKTSVYPVKFIERKLSKERGCFILGFGGYVREYVLHFFRDEMIAALDYKAEIIKRHYGSNFPIYHRFDDILEEIAKVKKPLVIVSTYHSDHAWMTKEVLECNQSAYVFVEKPPAVTNEDADILFNLRQNGGWIDIGFNRRYSLFSHIICNFLQDSEAPFHITFLVKELKIPRNHWYFWPNQGTRVLGNGVHWVDLLRFFTKKNVSNFFVVGRDGNLTVSVELEDNSVCEIIITDIGDDFYGVEEYIEVRFNDTTIKLYDYRELEVRNKYKSLHYRKRRRDKGHFKMYSTLRENFLNGGVPLYPADDILWVTRFCNEVVQYMKEKE